MARHANADDSQSRSFRKGRKEEKRVSRVGSSSQSKSSKFQTKRATGNPAGFRPAYVPGTQGYAANSAYSRQSAVSQYSRETASYAGRRTSRGKKVAIVFACVFAVLLATTGAAFAWVNGINKQLNTGNKTQEEIDAINQVLEPNPDPAFKEPFYMMLIGTDSRPDVEGEVGRSDTNIVVRVDPRKNQATLVSIPRDTMIKLNGSTTKFNAAYSEDQAAGAITEADKLLNIKISHYAEVNFDSLKALVDAVGGVDIMVDELVDDPDADGTSAHPEWPRVIIQPGMQHLNGNEALVFARSRAYVDGDFTRTANQRKLIMAIVNKVLELPANQLPSVIDAASKCVTTDLSVGDIVSLAQQFKDEGELTIYSAMLPSTTATIDGISYVINDEKNTKKMMEIVEAGGDPSTIEADSTNSSSVSSQGYSGETDGYSPTYSGGSSGYNTGGGYYDAGSVGGGYSGGSSGTGAGSSGYTDTSSGGQGTSGSGSQGSGGGTSGAGSGAGTSSGSGTSSLGA